MRLGIGYQEPDGTLSKDGVSGIRFPSTPIRLC